MSREKKPKPPARGRPAEGKGSTPIFTRVHDDVLARLDREATRRKLTRGQMLRALAEEHLP